MFQRLQLLKKTGAPMIDLHYWPTPNGHKISIMLEECALEYKVIPVDIGAGDQFKPEFLRISPNNRMPAIVDSETGEAIFEGGAILIYLAEKCGRFLPTEQHDRMQVLQWLFDREFLAGDYSIADIASFPWVIPYRRLGNDLDKFKNLRRWFDAIKERSAVQTGVDLGKAWKTGVQKSDDVHAMMFNQNSETIMRAVEALED
jgi:GST-like protein